MTGGRGRKPGGTEGEAAGGGTNFGAKGLGSGTVAGAGSRTEAGTVMGGGAKCWAMGLGRAGATVDFWKWASGEVSGTWAILARAGASMVLGNMVMGIGGGTDGKDGW